MYREMRRIKQQLPANEIRAVLERNTSGVLGVNGDGGYPYTVPLNFVYHNEKIYFHCAKEGHKIDVIRRDPRVCFTVIDEDTMAGELYTSLYRSVTAFGKAYIVSSENERLEAFLALAEKYSACRPREEREKTVNGCARSLLVGISIEHITGKEAAQYARERR